FIAGLNKKQFVANELVRSAVLQKLTIIGEAASNVRQAVRDRHPEIPWVQIRGLRNIVVHHYFGVSWELVWGDASEEVPKLKTKIANILAAWPSQ
ncbi:MAG: DUF86 domain-containing protein, partial [Acidobacteriia bacterium]|nr:DUF86 domain-containing protein [Terriglobia bacterium]